MINITLDDHDLVKAISGRPINLGIQQYSNPQTGLQQARQPQTQGSSAPSAVPKTASPGMEPIQ